MCICFHLRTFPIYSCSGHALKCQAFSQMTMSWWMGTGHVWVAPSGWLAGSHLGQRCLSFNRKPGICCLNRAFKSPKNYNSSRIICVINEEKLLKLIPSYKLLNHFAKTQFVHFGLSLTAGELRTLEPKYVAV